VYKRQGSEAWEELKEGTDNALDELNKAVKDATNRLG
jgi:hypothetical protein